MTNRPFRVWAPNPVEVELVVDGQSVAMARGPGGWWSVEIDGVAEGVRYGYRLDGDEPLPDPRSPSQPDGVHGLSAVVDHGRFPWTDSAWRGLPVASALLYELHIGTFTPDGTFDSAIERLDHLVELGVDAIELLPVAEFSGDRGWGYDGVDLFAPHHAYGGPDGLKRLVDACHGRNLGVVLDVVYNHLGPAGNYLGRFGPYFTDRYRTPWGEAVNLDGPGSDEVRGFFIDNALQWLRDYHVDGLRLDAVHAIVDTSATHFLEQLAGAVEQLAAADGRHRFVVAESDLNDPRLVRSTDAGGFGLDAAWSDDFHHALHVALTGEREGYYEDFSGIPDVVTALRRGYVYVGQRSRHRGRRHGRSPVGLPLTRFVAYAQNHDQVGNRALGDRLTALTDEGGLRIAAALVLLGPFVPMLFQGEEWGAATPFLYFTDHEDSDLGDAVRDGRRREFAAFGWDPEKVPDPQGRGTFSASVLVWEEIDDPAHASLYDWYRELIALRRRWPELHTGRVDQCWLEPGTSCVAMTRGRLAVFANFGDDPALLRSARAAETARGRSVLTASAAADVDRAPVMGEGPGTDKGSIVVPARAVVVLGPSGYVASMTSTPSEHSQPDSERLDELEEEIEEVRQRLRKEEHVDERHFIDDGPLDRDVDDNIAPPG